MGEVTGSSPVETTILGLVQNASSTPLVVIYYSALDGNVKEALEKLNAIDLRTQTPTELKTRKKYLNCFGNSKQRYLKILHLSLVDEINEVYKSYWNEVLLQKLNQTEGNNFLFNKFKPIVIKLGGTINPFNEAEYDRISHFLTLKLKEKGFFARIGVLWL